MERNGDAVMVWCLMVTLAAIEFWIGRCTARFEVRRRGIRTIRGSPRGWRCWCSPTSCAGLRSPSSRWRRRSGSSSCRWRRPKCSPCSFCRSTRAATRSSTPSSPSSSRRTASWSVKPSRSRESPAVSDAAATVPISATGRRLETPTASSATRPKTEAPTVSVRLVTSHSNSSLSSFTVHLTGSSVSAMFAQVSPSSSEFRMKARCLISSMRIYNQTPLSNQIKKNLCLETDEVAGSAAASSPAPPSATLAPLPAAHVHEAHPHRRHRRHGIVLIGQRVRLPDRRDPAEAAPTQTPPQPSQGRIGTFSVQTLNILSYINSSTDL